MRRPDDGPRSAKSPAPEHPERDADLEALWRRSTEAGNLAFEDRDHAAALRSYELALTIAERMFDAALDGGSPLLAPMLYNISCANAAEVMVQAGNHPAASAFLCRALDKLVTSVESASSPIALRLNCVRHLHYAFEIMSRDFAEETERPDVKALFTRGANGAIKVMQIATAMMPRYGGSRQDDAGHRHARPN